MGPVRTVRWIFKAMRYPVGLPPPRPPVLSRGAPAPQTPRWGALAPQTPHLILCALGALVASRVGGGRNFVCGVAMQRACSQVCAVSGALFQERASPRGSRRGFADWEEPRIVHAGNWHFGI